LSRLNCVLQALKRFLAIVLLLLAAPLVAGVRDDVGFTRLKSELGDDLPTGKGLSLGQVESSMAVDHDGDDATPELRSWFPNPAARNLQESRLIDRSNAPAEVYSRHATAVARRIVGRKVGMVSDIEQLHIFSVNHWIGNGMLRARTPRAPVAGQLRVINHSWAANGRSSEILRRADWLTDREEVIQVVGVRNAAGKENDAYLAALHNAIVVGRSDGLHSVGTPAVDSIYTRGRSRPHLVAPLKTGSAAAPTVTSAIALLLDAAANPSYSQSQEAFVNSGGVIIHDAGRSEVVRAILMAGAERATANSSHGDIVGYRDGVRNRTNNGLDRRYGAGQLNVFNAWNILRDGEQEQQLRHCGFDYEPGLGGSAAHNKSKAYLLPKVISPGRLSATLSWNLLFSPGRNTRFDISAALNNLDLELFDISADQPRLVQSSNSHIDTTETIFAKLLPGRQYRLLVTRVDDGEMPQDYALAWRLVPD